MTVEAEQEWAGGGVPPAGFNPNMAEAPRDRPILGWCVHSANAYRLSDSHLTTYGAHCEGMGHVGDGPHVLEWGGEWDDADDGYIPNWWFRRGSEWEEAANPIGWIAIPTPDDGAPASTKDSTTPLISPPTGEVG